MLKTFKMETEITTSAESYSSAPRGGMSYTGSIPKLVIPASKYSSTETELTTDYEDGSSNENIGRLSLSGVSTSAASLSGSSHQHKRRRKKRTVSSRISSSSLSLSVWSVKSGSSGVGHASFKKIVAEGDNDENLWTMPRKKGMESFLVLNSLGDLKNAVGRHRGISGSSSPAVDVTLFAMFYLTDAFDDLLVDGLPHHSIIHAQSKTNLHNNISLKQDLLSLLRKQIVYSLRMNYFCPASKVVKLVQLVEENYPLEQTQDPAGFLDLLCRKILKPVPFLTYSNGEMSFIHHIPLEHYFERKYSYFQPAALTIHNLLRQTGLFSTGGNKRNKRHERNSVHFATVPYPVLILKVTRKDPSEEIVSNEQKFFWGRSPEMYQHQMNKPIIPNMKIDITDLIAKNSSRETSHGSNLSETILLKKSLSNQEKNIHCDFTDAAADQGNVESRFFKGLKSAWKVMFRYLEDLTVSSAHIGSQESSPPLENARINNHSTNYPSRRNHTDDVNDEMDPFNEEKINHLLSSSLSSSVSFRSSPHSLSGSGYSCKHDVYESFTGTRSRQIQVKMELMAVICKSRKISKMTQTDQCEKSTRRTASFSRYSVYCKAGSDVVTAGENPQYAPWVLYQSRNGVAPQVVLIENFGKWIDSLERHHENFNLCETPMEIRRVLEDSLVFIYKRLEK